MNNQRRSGMILSYISIFISSIIGIAFTPFLIVSLGVEEYGLYQLLYATIGFVSLLDFGLGGTLTRYIIKYKASEEKDKVASVVSMCVKIYCVTGVVVILTTIIIAFILEPLFPGSINSNNVGKARFLFIIMGATAGVSFIRHALSGIQGAEEKYAVMKFVVILQHILRTVFILILLLIGMKAEAVVLVDLFVAMVLLLFEIYYCKSKLKYQLFAGKWDKVLFKSLVTFSLFVFLQIIITQVNNNLPRIILGKYVCLEYVSIYGVAMQLQNLFNSVGGVISGITLPQVSRIVFCNGTIEQTTDCCSHYSRYQLHISAFILGGFILFGQYFISLWVPDYNCYEVYIIILLIAVPQILEAVEGTIFNVMKAKNMQATRSLILLGVVVFNIIFSVILIKYLPLYGAAIGTCVSFVIGNNILSNIYYHKKVGINIYRYFKNLLKGILPVWLVTFVIGIFISKIHISGWNGLFLKCCIYSIIYIPLMYIYGFSKSEKQLVTNIIHKIRR